jgi:hypothetical protein
MNTKNILLDFVLKFLHEKADKLKLKYEEHEAYKKWKEEVKEVSKEHNIEFNEKDLDDIFSKPRPLIVDNEIIYDENDNPLNQEEFSVENGSIKYADIGYVGWLNDDTKREELINNNFYKGKIFLGIGDMTEEVKKSIELHALHILDRCNNPYEWEQTKEPQKKLEEWLVNNNAENGNYWDNKQGLVYGMVQSGKTASMIALMGLAHCAGYKLLIVLSGDKTSLRNQTQKRINDAFKLRSNGSPKGHQENIQSITELVQDYSDATQNQNNGLEVFNENLRDKNTIIICIKKNNPNLTRLYNHLNEVKQHHLNEFNFETDLKTIIIDDEADYASQNTNRHDTSAIHNSITKIRTLLPQNTYVAYTATPQACLGADPKKLVGYPKHFIWLLDPFRDEDGKTTSYLGLQEFFNSDYKNNLIYNINKDAWPHWEKNDGIREGIYDANGIVVKTRLQEEEEKKINIFINDEEKRKSHCNEYREAITDFLITCALRWYRHYIEQKRNGKFQDNLPSKDDVKLPNFNDGETTKGFKVFPYHAMLFNLAYINDIQQRLVELIEILVNEVKDDYNTTKEDKWETETSFKARYNRQLDKTSKLDSPSLPIYNTLEPFIDIAIAIACDDLIENDDKYIYILNSADDGHTLDYNSNNQPPKKAAIIIGGLILGRGLTVENLSTSVFIRSQSESLGDTNLQMCRWFGHKKKDLDLQSVYMQKHSRILFEDIANADKDLRTQFMEYLYKNTPAKCILLQLRNSPLFKLTSPTKGRFFKRGDKSSYSGKNINLEEPMKNSRYIENNDLLDNYLETLEGVESRIMNNRAKVYYDVGIDNFRKFFNGLHIEEDAMLVSPSRYDEYLRDWHDQRQGNLPGLDIAVFGHDGHLNRAKESNTVIDRYRKFRGGKGGKYITERGKRDYIGDEFVDKERDFHIKNYSTRGLKREKNDSILVMFYKLNPHYKNKTDTPIKSQEVMDGMNQTPILTYAISTPLGGPLYAISENKGQRLVANDDDCINLEEQNNVYEE